MKIQSKEFRVLEGDEVNLKKRPTVVHPLYQSKEQYREALQDHVARLLISQKFRLQEFNLYPGRSNAIFKAWFETAGH